MKFSVPRMRILDFDIEARPLGWYGGEWVHAEPTAIAWAWVPEDDDEEIDVQVRQLTRRPRSDLAMLKAFYKVYNEADMVTGHYIRGYDLPSIQGALMEHDLPLLSEKLTHDTKGDLLKAHGKSKSQQNLGAELGIEAPKVGMTNADWRAANRLTEEGLAFARERVIGDVIQHIEMRREMLRRGWLSAPKMWYPGGAESRPYVP